MQQIIKNHRFPEDSGKSEKREAISALSSWRDSGAPPAAAVPLTQRARLSLYSL